MSDIVIKAENLGKKYVIGHRAENGRYVALRDVLMQNARTLWNKTKDLAKGKPIIQGDTLEEVWALKDTSFEIHRGETFGIIGRNGAGKSTLLKVLSRITEPSAGRVTIKGRVASLLEVGTGFHPELTGRENLYLNGAILGMTRAEIKQKFDEIVAFAEVEQFLDTPVKRYSSGMYVRLAFAVAAHLEPDILVVDEVLAVGDTEFQKKCLGKMGDVAHEGRTVLFVSHNMNAIQRLCKRCIVLSQGLTVFDGEVSSAVSCYLKNKDANQQISWPDIGCAPGDDVVRLRSVRIVGQDGIVRSQFDVRDPIVLEIEFQVLKEAPISVIVQFIGALGTYIMVSMDNYIKGPWGKQPPYSVGIYKSSCYIPGDFLNEGQLSANLWIYSPPFASSQSCHVKLIDAVCVDIGDSFNPGGARGQFPYEWGIEPAVRPKLRWTTEQVGNNND
ncbi:MAG: polysaccharide ABC transporter ATP-binding protein [Planctomycetota bacterium]